MKKILCLLLALSFALSLAACSKLDGLELPPLPDVEAIKEEAAQAEAQEQQPSAQPDTVAPDAAQSDEGAVPENHVIVSFTSHSETYMDPQFGTEPILEFSYETPVVYVEGRDEASQLINEHIAMLDETYQTGNDYGYGSADGVNLLLEMATDNYGYIVNSGEDGLNMLYSSSRSAKTARADEKVLSLVFNTYVFTGGAHGNYVDRAYVFDTETGENVSLDMLSSQPDELKAFLKEYMISLYETDENGYYSERMFAEIENIIDISLEEAIGALLREGSWYFGDEGIVIFSDVYELGSYAAGIIEFVVPYAQLEGRIDEKWLPIARSGQGSMQLCYQSEIEDGSAQVIDRLTIDDEGEQLCLVADGVVYNVRLSEVSYIDKFYEAAQLWACSYMDDCILQLDVNIPEGMPNLMLSYTDASGEIQSFLLTQSGEDGSLILADDDIEAVG